MRWASIVFTDPDNGMILSRIEQVRRRKPSHKHSYWHEIAAYLANGKSVVAYHHLGRQRGGHEQEIRRCLGEVPGCGHGAWAIRYRRGTSRAFFVIPSSKIDSEWLQERSVRFVESHWREHALLIR